MRKFAAIALCLFLFGCGKSAKVSAPVLDEPDQVLFQKAMKEMDRHNYPGSRLLLQTLISTYQDSDYFEHAKYALAESFYREGGRENLDSSEAAFKDFIIYFKESDLADDAQLWVAMTHIRRVQSPDRDNTEARLAELELKELINSYPDSDLLEEAKEKLRDVEEVLAMGNFKIANQYFLRKNYKAAIDRFKEIEDKYPDFSKMDLALFNHAEALRLNKNEEASGKFYAEIASDYPMSTRAKLARERLMEMKVPVPPPNPVAIANPPPQEDKGVLGKALGAFKSHPAVPTETGAATIRAKDAKEKNSISVEPQPKKD